MRKCFFAHMTALVCCLTVVGCGGSVAKNVASQPNGPPKARPSTPERIDSPAHQEAAIVRAVAFARDKYKNKILDYDHARGSVISAVNLKASAPPASDSPPPGSWRVIVPMLKVESADVSGPSTTERMGISEEVQLLARIFIVYPAGSVKEVDPMLAPPVAKR